MVCLPAATDPTANHPGGMELGVRPEDVTFLDPSDDRAHLRGSVLLVERLSNLTIAYVDTEAGQVVVELRGDHHVRVGDVVGLALDPAQVLPFLADGAALT